MSITFQTGGALAYSATNGSTVAPPYPANCQAGDALFLGVGQKPTNVGGGTISPPGDWELVYSKFNGGGYSAQGNDSGNTNIALYRKIAAGGESGTITVNLTDNSVSWAAIGRMSNATGVWSFAGAGGEDITGGTDVSVAMDQDPGVEAGDAIWGLFCIPTDVSTPTQFSAEAFSQSGVTFGAVTERAEPDSSNGTDIGGFICNCLVTSGTSSGLSTMTATAGGTTTNVRGPGLFIRAREEPANHALTPSGLTVGAPVLGSVDLDQDHELVPSGLATGAPTLATADLDQDHVLSPSGLATGAPTLGTPTLTEQENYELLPSGLTLGAPVLSPADLDQDHVLDLSDLLVGSPDLGHADLDQDHELVPLGLLAGSPDLGHADVGQDHVLTPVGLLIGSPDLGHADLDQDHVFDLSDLLIGAPDLGHAMLGDGAILDPSDLTVGAPVLSLVDLDQDHELVPLELLIGAPVLGHPNLSGKLAYRLSVATIVSRQPLASASSRQSVASVVDRGPLAEVGED